MRIVLLLFLLLIFSVSCSNYSNKWIFTMSVDENNKSSLNDREHCRLFMFSNSFIEEKCTVNTNNLFCEGDHETFVIHIFNSEIECKKNFT